MPANLPRRFHLQRHRDISGASGTGRVAVGVQWPDGTASVRWLGERPSTVVWDSMADAEHVHGHGGATEIVWDDEQQPAVPEPRGEHPARSDRPVDTEPVHTWFSLSYSNYLVLPRALMQSMPVEWQERMVTCLDEMHEAFRHVPQAEAYEVAAGTQHEIGDLTPEQMQQLGITADYYGGETPPEGLSDEELAAWKEQHEDPEGPRYYRDGEELESHYRVLLPCPEPVPHYNRGRTHIEPRP